MTLSPLGKLLSRKRLLIFDLDGTLVDSSPLHARAFSETFEPEGVAVNYPEIAGMTTAAAVDRLLENSAVAFAPETRARLIKAKKRRSLELMERDLVAIDGAVEFVSAARTRFPLALCTSASRASVAAALRCTGLDGSFDPVLTGEDVNRSKPEPDCYLAAVNAHGVAPEDALAFEDSASGLEAARRAGIDVIRIAAAVTDEDATDWRALLEALRQLK